MKFQKWKLVFLSICIFSAGWLLGISISPQENKFDGSDSQTTGLRMEIEAAQKRLDFLKHNTREGNASKTHSTPAISSKPETNRILSPDEQKTLQMPDTLPIADLPKTKFKTLYDAIDTFQSEIRNDEWAGIREARLSDAFATDPNLFGREVDSIECKSTQCKIKIRAENKQDAISIAQKINFLIATKQGEYFTPHINLTFDEKSQLASFYLTHDKNTTKRQ